MSDQDFPKLAYPDEYEGPRRTEVDYLTKDPEEPQPKPSEETEAGGASRQRAKTVYPPEYTPPKTDGQDASDQMKTSSPMHYKPIVRKTSYRDQPAFREIIYPEDTELVARDNYW